LAILINCFELSILTTTIIHALIFQFSNLDSLISFEDDQ